jgi:hypothetical protein
MSRREPERDRERERSFPERMPDRKPERHRDVPRPLKQVIRLKQSQIDVLYDAGRFRVVPTEDVAMFRYDGDFVAMRKDVDFLQRHNLIERSSLVSLRRPPRQILTLTKDGHRRLRSLYPESGQRFQHGIQHPMALEHDAAIYRMYYEEVAQLQSSGMKPLRVQTDGEMKSRFWREVDQDGKSWSLRSRSKADVRERVAAANGLAQIDGVVQFPDIRIEYEKPDGELGRVDLELTTENYSRAQIAAKSAAGMKIYGQKTPTWGPAHDPQIAAGMLEL